jgi:threonine/homoserine/homoserine lactone efflux protein
VISGSSLAVYLAASAALAVVPGPAVLYIVSQSVHGGRRTGALSALGVATGGLVHVAAAVLGLSALVVASAEAFTAVKIVGAVYLVLLGIRALRSPGEEIGGHRHERDPWRAYRQGAVVNILNPKTALFFLAFLPQFVDANRAARPQLAVLGALFLGIALTSDLVWALVAGTAGNVLRRSRAFLRMQRYVSGGVFIGLGVLAAFTGHTRARA